MGLGYKAKKNMLYERYRNGRRHPFSHIPAESDILCPSILRNNPNIKK